MKLFFEYWPDVETIAIRYSEENGNPGEFVNLAEEKGAPIFASDTNSPAVTLDKTSFDSLCATGTSDLNSSDSIMLIGHGSYMGVEYKVSLNKLLTYSAASHETLAHNFRHGHIKNHENVKTSVSGPEILKIREEIERHIKAIQDPIIKEVSRKIESVSSSKSPESISVNKKCEIIKEESFEEIVRRHYLSGKSKSEAVRLAVRENVVAHGEYLSRVRNGKDKRLF